METGKAEETATSVTLGHITQGPWQTSLWIMARDTMTYTYSDRADETLVVLR